MSAVIERSEMLLPGPAQALGGLLGVPVPDLSGDAGLPLLWHWVYLLERPAQADLGPDGHPIRGTVPEPPGPGRRRMWAGGSVRVTGALRCGQLATKRTTVLSVQEKHGRSGNLTFAAVGHQIRQDGRLVIDERQDIVYREAISRAGQPPDPPEVDLVSEESRVLPPSDGEWALETPPSLLFRFSALTYNAHRIHYDRDYARDVEGYPGLLTHGPLQALVMAEAARAYGCHGDQHFEYRLVAPLFDYQGIVVKASREADATATTVRDKYGRTTASGTLRSIGGEARR